VGHRIGNCRYNTEGKESAGVINLLAPVDVPIDLEPVRGRHVNELRYAAR